MRRAGVVVGTLGILLAFSACTPVVQQKVNTNVPVNTTSNENVNTASLTVNATTNLNTSPAPANTNASAVAALVSPMDRRAERVTKKMFGTYITPKTSPVQPERFTGYHTGLDYETFPTEAKTEASVFAACTGKVRALQTVSGYGGVLVQQCVVAGQTVTALYGHIRLSSVKVKVGTELKAGTQFAVLGTGFSSETGGERKHLHFSLHKGTAINWRGYVSTKAALVDWLDPLLYLPKT
jgi:murein DD-endopeptidase MepM/ murein hydrolase activator NlpD